MNRKRFIGNAEGIRVWRDGKWVKPALSKRADDLKDASAKQEVDAGRSADSGNASDREQK